MSRRLRYVAFGPAAEHLFTHDQSDDITAARIGCDKRSVVRWRKAGRIPWAWADRICVAYSTHPRLVWGSDWEEVVEWPLQPERREKDRPETPS